MIIYSWNVNGIRAVSKKGFLEWLEKTAPDILCIQETKAHPEQLTEEVLSPEGYASIFSSAEKKGYSGTAIYYKKSLGINRLENSLGLAEFDSEGRTTILETDDLILLNGYFPNGQRDHSRVPYKLSYCQAISEWALEQNQKNKTLIITGDYNTAHKSIDLANPKQNQNTTGFLEIEREWLDQFESEGMIDLYRELNPDKEGAYTWWTYRSNCRQRNIGWRIDYFFGNEQCLNRLKSADLHPEVLGSDHCPISIQLNTVPTSS